MASRVVNGCCCPTSCIRTGASFAFVATYDSPIPTAIATNYFCDCWLLLYGIDTWVWPGALDLAEPKAYDVLHFIDLLT